MPLPTPLPPSVLVVDDDDAIREAIRVLLEDEGYVVYEAPDGKPALARLRAHPEGMVVLLDVHMPGMDGLTLLRALDIDERLATRHAIILLSAHLSRTLPLDVATLLTRLNVPVLGKPFAIDDLVTVVQAAAQRLAHSHHGEQPPAPIA